MEFLVEFDVNIRAGAPESEVRARVSAEADASAELAREGHLVRLWRPPVADAVSYIVTRARRVAVNELLVRAAEQTW